jgi:hypothetical protein
MDDNACLSCSDNEGAERDSEGRGGGETDTSLPRSRKDERNMSKEERQAVRAQRKMIAKEQKKNRHLQGRKPCERYVAAILVCTYPCIQRHCNLSSSDSNSTDRSLSVLMVSSDSWFQVTPPLRARVRKQLQQARMRGPHTLSMQGVGRLEARVRQMLERREVFAFDRCAAVTIHGPHTCMPSKSLSAPTTRLANGAPKHLSIDSSPKHPTGHRHQPATHICILIHIYLASSHPHQCPRTFRVRI